MENHTLAVATATGTLLDYTISPDKVPASATQSFTLTATNPPTGRSIVFAPGANGDEILLTIPAPPAETGATALVDLVSFDAQSRTSGFIAGRDTVGGNVFAIRALGQMTFAPGARIEVQLTAVPVNAIAGTATLGIEEAIGNGDAKTTVTVEKQAAGISVVAWLSRAAGGDGEAVTLFWQSTGGTHVDVAGLDEGDGTRRFPVAGKTPPYQGQTSFIPRKPGPMPLTLTVRTNDGLKSATTTVTLDVRTPFVGYLSPDPADGTLLEADRSVTLDWSVLYARTVTLTVPSGAGPVLVPGAPLSPVRLSPGYDIQLGAPAPDAIAGAADYVLTATGFGAQVQRTVSFPVAPVQLLYFKFMQKDAAGLLSGVGQALSQPDWGSYAMTLAAVNTFSLFQPGGGGETWYLGDGDTTHPQIQYFNAIAPPANGQATVEWVTANLTALVLDPGAQAIPAAQIRAGQMTVPVPASGRLTLTGTSASGESVPSVLLFD
jgi:hypothetical protein